MDARVSDEDPDWLDNILSNNALTRNTDEYVPTITPIISTRMYEPRNPAPRRKTGIIPAIVVIEVFIVLLLIDRTLDSMISDAFIISLLTFNSV